MLKYFPAVWIIAMLSLVPVARGEALSFVLDAPQPRMEEARVIARQLGRLGIDVAIQAWDRAELHRAMKAGTRMASLTDWGSAFFDPFDLAVPKLKTRGRGNYSFYSNARVDHLFDVAASAQDVGVRSRAYRSVQRILSRQSPWVFGYIRPMLTGVAPKVEGFTPGMDGRFNLHDVRMAGRDSLTVDMATSGFVSLDPAMHRDRATESVIRNMFDGLVTRTPDGVVVPEMAERWRRQGDLEWVFTLRGGITFHDGSPVTARDVAFTFQRVLGNLPEGGPSPRRGLLGPLKSVAALESGEVLFTLEKPFPVFLQALVHFQIVPEAYVRKVGAVEFARHPIGCGPFRFVSGDVLNGVTMERYGKYYGGSPALEPIGPAQLDRVTFRPVPDSWHRKANLVSGAAQIIQGVAEEDRAELERLGLRALDTAGTRSYQMELNNHLPPFNDIRVRRALALAIDWDEVIAKAYGGRATRLATCFLPSGFGYDSSLAPVAHDPDMARKLLRSAGYDVISNKGDAQ